MSKPEEGVAKDPHQALSDAVGELRLYEFRLGQGEKGTLQQRADDAVERIWRAVGEIERFAREERE